MAVQGDVGQPQPQDPSPHSSPSVHSRPHLFTSGPTYRSETRRGSVGEVKVSFMNFQFVHRMNFIQRKVSMKIERFEKGEAIFSGI